MLLQANKCWFSYDFKGFFPIGALGCVITKSQAIIIKYKLINICLPPNENHSTYALKFLQIGVTYRQILY